MMPAPCRCEHKDSQWAKAKLAWLLMNIAMPLKASALATCVCIVQENCQSNCKEPDPKPSSERQTPQAAPSTDQQGHSLSLAPVPNQHLNNAKESPDPANDPAPSNAPRLAQLVQVMSPSVALAPTLPASPALRTNAQLPSNATEPSASSKISARDLVSSTNGGQRTPSRPTPHPLFPTTSDATFQTAENMRLPQAVANATRSTPKRLAATQRMQPEFKTTPAALERVALRTAPVCDVGIQADEAVIAADSHVQSASSAQLQVGAGVEQAEAPAVEGAGSGWAHIILPPGASFRVSSSASGALLTTAIFSAATGATHGLPQTAQGALLEPGRPPFGTVTPALTAREPLGPGRQPQNCSHSECGDLTAQVTGPKRQLFGGHGTGSKSETLVQSSSNRALGTHASAVPISNHECVAHPEATQARGVAAGALAAEEGKDAQAVRRYDMFTQTPHRGLKRKHGSSNPRPTQAQRASVAVPVSPVLAYTQSSAQVAAHMHAPEVNNATRQAAGQFDGVLRDRGVQQDMMDAEACSSDDSSQGWTAENRGDGPGNEHVAGNEGSSARGRDSGGHQDCRGLQAAGADSARTQQNAFSGRGAPALSAADCVGGSTANARTTWGGAANAMSPAAVQRTPCWRLVKGQPNEGVLVFPHAWVIAPLTCAHWLSSRFSRVQVGVRLASECLTAHLTRCLGISLTLQAAPWQQPQVSASSPWLQLWALTFR